MKPRARRLAAALVFTAPVCVNAAPPSGAGSCLGCHPAAASDGPVLSLTMLTAAQIETAMHAFRADTRPATVMNRIAKAYNDDEIRAIASWYGSGEDP